MRTPDDIEAGENDGGHWETDLRYSYSREAAAQERRFDQLERMYGKPVASFPIRGSNPADDQGLGI